MKYILTAIVCAQMFASCSNPDIEVQPTGSFDTMGIKWMTIERNNIIYYFQGTGVNGASLYTDMHEEAYTKLSAIFNPQLPKKLRYFVWMDWDQARSKLNPPEWSGGVAYPWVCVCHVKANISLGHEMTHVMSYWANGVKQESYSRLITEGVAVVFDLGDYNRLDGAKEALKTESGKKFNSVAEFWVDTASEIDEKVFYPVAGAFMEFMYKKNMTDKFFALLRNQRRDEAEAIYGKDQLDALIKEFDRLAGM